LHRRRLTQSVDQEWNKSSISKNTVATGRRQRSPTNQRSQAAQTGFGILNVSVLYIFKQHWHYSSINDALDNVVRTLCQTIQHINTLDLELDGSLFAAQASQ
jgi:hypothetical protein